MEEFAIYEDLLPWLGMAAFVVLGVWHWEWNKRRSRARLDQLAAELGLTAAPVRRTFGLFLAESEASGTLQGRPSTLRVGCRRSRGVWTQLTVTPAPYAGLAFSLASETLEDRMFAALGWRELKIGDARFDAAWFIRTNAPDFLGAALLPELRTRFEEALAGPGGRVPQEAGRLSCVDGEVRYRESGYLTKPACCERFRRIAPVLGDFAALAEIHAGWRR